MDQPSANAAQVRAKSALVKMRIQRVCERAKIEALFRVAYLERWYKPLAQERKMEIKR
jgi:hypothetical protein